MRSKFSPMAPTKPPCSNFMRSRGSAGILKKLEALGRDLDDYSLETVKMFYDDAC